MPRNDLHHLSRIGDERGLRLLLESPRGGKAPDVDARDADGLTP